MWSKKIHPWDTSSNLLFLAYQIYNTMALNCSFLHKILFTVAIIDLLHVKPVNAYVRLSTWSKQICDFCCNSESFADWYDLTSGYSNENDKSPMPGRVGVLKCNSRKAVIGYLEFLWSTRLIQIMLSWRTFASLFFVPNWMDEAETQPKHAKIS